MNTTQSLIAAATFVSVISAAPAAFAVDEYNVSKGTTVAGHGVAFRANDVVALVTGLGVVPGQAKHTHVHDGVAYYFASEETMKQFAATPEKYMPQYGGYCAFGVAVGKKLDGSPRFADIVDGKLYLFLNAGVFRKYEEDKAGVLAKAAANWPGMHRVSVAEVNGGGS
ncbi:MAG: YHS domain-containing (seleno)protein [Hyphomicrobiaceae bacterium]